MLTDQVFFSRVTVFLLATIRLVAKMKAWFVTAFAEYIKFDFEKEICYIL